MLQHYYTEYLNSSSRLRLLAQLVYCYKVWDNTIYSCDNNRYLHKIDFSIAEKEIKISTTIVELNSWKKGSIKEISQLSLPHTFWRAIYKTVDLRGLQFQTLWCILLKKPRYQNLDCASLYGPKWIGFEVVCTTTLRKAYNRCFRR